ncbi:hypothetical protein [Streptomyces sp. NPDC018584]|uniref:hypothetical protein n=1 Tax=unclassified Streptomyces TaxID=2593676 RepID=UPI0037B8A6FE
MENLLTAHITAHITAHTTPRTHRLRSLQRAPIPMHGKPPQHNALGLAEQLPTPVDHRTQRLLPGRRPPLPRREQPEAITEAVGQLPYAQATYARSGKLQSERNTVQPPTDPGDGLRVPRTGEREPRRRGSGTGNEQLDRVGAPQRLHQEHRLAREPQRLLTGGKDPQPGRGPQQRVRERGGLLDDLLAVVEDEKYVPVPQRGGEAFEGPGGGPGHRRPGGHVITDPEHTGDDLRETGDTAPRALPGELHDPRTVRKPLTPHGTRGGLDGEPRLPHPAGPGQRDEPRDAQQPLKLIDARLTSHEGGEGGGKVGTGEVMAPTPRRRPRGRGRLDGQGRTRPDQELLPKNRIPQRHQLGPGINAQLPREPLP